MSSLEVYYQDANLIAHENFRPLCSQSDFDVVCVTNSWLEESVSDDAVVDVREFDILRLDYEDNNEPNYTIWGSFIAVRKRLSAQVRREWMVEGVDCVWVTVPSRGCRSRLHVACVDFSDSDNIDPFTESLAALTKTHPNDTFLVVGRFPPFKGDWISDEHQPTQHDVITRLRSSTSRAGLRQFNNIKGEDDKLYNLVFSSVPVTVARCPRPLAPEKKSWSTALQFDLNIGPAECCQTANDAAGGRRETRQEDVGALVDALVQSKWEDVTRSLPELIERGLERSAAALRENSERFAAMEERLRTLEERVLAHRETGLFAGLGGRQTSGTVVKYAPAEGTELTVEGGMSSPINVSYNCISCMKEYETKSLEELRIEDYAASRKGPSVSQRITFGQPATYGTSQTGAFDPATRGDIFRQSSDEYVNASGAGSTANAPLTTTSSLTTSSQPQRTMKYPIDGKLFKKATEEVKAMSTSSPVFKDDDTTPTRMESRISDTKLIKSSTSGSASNLNSTQFFGSLSSPTTVTASSSLPTEAAEASPDLEVRDILASTDSTLQAPSSCSASTKLNEIRSLLGSVQLNTEKNEIVPIEIGAKSDNEKAIQEDATEQKRQNSMILSECAASCSNKISDSNIVESTGSSEGDATANVTTRGSVCEAEVCSNEAQKSRNQAGELRKDRKSFGGSKANKLANVMTSSSELFGEKFDPVNLHTGEWQVKLLEMHNLLKNFKPNVDSSVGSSVGVANSDDARYSETDESSNTSDEDPK